MGLLTNLLFGYIGCEIASNIAKNNEKTRQLEERVRELEAEAQSRSKLDDEHDFLCDSDDYDKF